MFDRPKYKKNALSLLKGKWKTAVIAILISTVIAGVAMAGYDTPENMIHNGTEDSIINYSSVSDGSSYSFHVYCDGPDTTEEWISLLITLSIIGVLTIAICHLFNEYYKNPEKISLSDFFKGFTLWLKGILSMLWYTLWVTLWSILFIIPGIIKAFAYSQMFFILAENPKIGINKAMRISKELTAGHKGELFIMMLSFIGWDVLSVFTLGILQLWIIPYKMMAFTVAYKDLKSNAIKRGYLTLEDFN